MKLNSIIDQALEDKGISAAEASRLAVGNSSAIKNIRLGQSPTIRQFEKLANVLGLELYIGPPRTEAIPEPPEIIPHYGEIGAGGSDFPTDGRIYEATGGATDTTGAPIDIQPQHLTRWGGLVALTVRGRSMEPLFRDGDTLYIYGDDPTASDPEGLIGKDCAVVLAGDRKGETYIKRIRRADNGKPGYFNLESINPIWHTMADVQLLQARPVRYIRRAI